MELSLLGYVFYHLLNKIKCLFKYLVNFTRNELMKTKLSKKRAISTVLTTVIILVASVVLAAGVVLYGTSLFQSVHSKNQSQHQESKYGYILLQTKV